jgi:hypothetical protein
MLPGIAAGDSWAGATIAGEMSPDAERLVRVVPGDSWGESYGFAGGKIGSHARAIFYERNDADLYVRTKEIELLNPVRPVDFFLTDAGELVTFDNWHNMGYGKVLVIYDSNGDLVVSYTLDELYQDAASIEALRKSVSSIWWRCGDPQLVGTVFTIYEANGGNFQLQLPSGEIKYEAGVHEAEVEKCR